MTPTRPAPRRLATPIRVALLVGGLATCALAPRALAEAAGAATNATPPAVTTPANVAWAAFLARLEETGRAILREDLPGSPLDRAEAQRYLLQRLAATIDAALDAESGPPVVSLYSHKLRKYGMDSADAKYMTVRVSGDGTYRLYGVLGTAHHIAFQLTSSRDGYRAFDSIEREGLDADASGEFELLVSATKPAGWTKPWLRLDPEATELLLREYFYDWAKERPSTFRVERLDRPGEAVPTEPAATRALFDAIADQFAATVPKWFAPALDDRLHRRNQLRPPARSASEGLRENAYGSGWFALADDEALLIELDEPEAHLWSFELGSAWWQSLDYVDHSSSLNGFQAVKSSDGRYRLVIALEDPAVPNWLDPVGHHEGVIIYRYQHAEPGAVPPTARVVPLKTLRDHLPADTPTVSAEARAAEIRMRRRHAATRWAP
ncbi:MAG: hypothetical protein R3F35_06180 [Myxococcota bacterium]